MFILKKRVMISVLSIFIFLGCGDDGNNGTVSSETLSKNFTYKTDSKYKDVLKNCIITKSCKLSKLPLIYNKNDGAVTKKLIMDRVLISHKWMGERFSEMLDILPNNLYKLFGAVTAIVIDKDINPSYYNSGTGAIYLSPRYLWLNPSEAQTISTKKDFRSNFSNDLIFYNASRYIKDEKYAYKSYSLDSNATRSKEDIKIAFARLLYHELAHANDYAPPSIILDLNQNLLPSGALTNKLSTALTNRYPLKSVKLKRLGQILYQGLTKTEEDKNITAKDMGSLFKDDIAVHMYAYSTEHEDLAMLFEATMMKSSFGIDQDTAFVYKKDNKYFVGWGERNRISDSSISERALFVVKSILPEETNWDSYFAGGGVGQSKFLNIDENWFTNLISKPKNSDNPSFKLDNSVHRISDFDIPGTIKF